MLTVLNIEDCTALEILPDLSHNDLTRLALHGSGLTEEALGLIRELSVPHVHIYEYMDDTDESDEFEDD